MKKRRRGSVVVVSQRLRRDRRAEFVHAPGDSRPNGEDRTIDVPQDNTPLLWVLREALGLKGTKFGCGSGFCGACTVHITGPWKKSKVAQLAKHLVEFTGQGVAFVAENVRLLPAARRHGTARLSKPE